MTQPNGNSGIRISGGTIHGQVVNQSTGSITQNVGAAGDDAGASAVSDELSRLPDPDKASRNPATTDPLRILMLSANPATTHRLALDEEAREIEEKLRLSRNRDSFDLVTRWAVRPADLLRFFNEVRPHIVHFSGHGDQSGEIVLSTGDGNGRPVPTEALAEVFRLMQREVRVVLLNACYTAVQAQAIGTHIDYVVGMRSSVQDNAAIVFSAAFYSALGYGRSVTEAFEQAVAAVALHGLSGYDLPHLHTRRDAQPYLTTDHYRQSGSGGGGR